MEENAAIASLGDIEVQREFEPVILASRDYVTCVLWVDACKRAFLDLPPGTHLGALEVRPAVERLAVEQQFPAGLLLRSAELVLGAVGIVCRGRRHSGRTGASNSGNQGCYQGNSESSRLNGHE